MKILSIIFLLLFVFFSGCREAEKKEPSYIRNESALADLVTEAVQGDGKANDSLSFLLDPQLPPKQDYSQKLVKEMRTAGGKKYYIVLLQNPNPVYNRAAVYDSSLNLYYLDKNLNGVLSFENLNIGGQELLLLSESFLSKDIINLSRLRLIKLDSNEVVPVLNIFTEVRSPKVEFRQVIEKITPEQIFTRITNLKRKSRPETVDSFQYNPADKKYISGSNSFQQIVLEAISNADEKNELSAITDSLSALRSAGIETETDSVSGASVSTNTEGFSFTFNEDWKKVTDVTMTDYLTRSMQGTKFINKLLGAEISVIRIPQKDSSEMYVLFPLPQSSQGAYKVRFSQKMESGKDYIQLFEYSCGKNKYLVIFKASKHSYYRNRDTYENIINSFAMEC